MHPAIPRPIPIWAPWGALAFGTLVPAYLAGQALLLGHPGEAMGWGLGVWLGWKLGMAMGRARWNSLVRYWQAAGII